MLNVISVLLISCRAASPIFHTVRMKDALFEFAFRSSAAAITSPMTPRAPGRQSLSHCLTLAPSFVQSRVRSSGWLCPVGR
jgi:hypothetical protein